eukprot:2045573-Prymnesium_polylepis.1
MYGPLAAKASHRPWENGARRCGATNAHTGAVGVASTADGAGDSTSSCGGTVQVPRWLRGVTPQPRTMFTGNVLT